MIRTKLIDKPSFDRVLDSAIETANAFMKTQSREYCIQWTSVMANCTIEEAISLLQSSNWDLCNIFKKIDV